MGSNLGGGCGGAERVQTIVDDLRTVSLAESGQLPLELVDLDAAELMRGVAQDFTPAAELADTRLSLELDDVPMRVNADRGRLGQMIGALVDNALRHTPSGGEIVLEAHLRSDIVELVVRDSGPGIPLADLPHVFERFYRGDPSRQRASGTSGLGLSIVQALADAQGASVGVENSAPHGARFWLRLSAVHPASSAA